MLDFDARNLSPMLFRESEEVFDSADHLYELKFDGIRSLAYLDDGTDLVNKRGKLLNATYPELADLHSSAKEKVLLDGEILLEGRKTGFLCAPEESHDDGPPENKNPSGNEPRCVCCL